MIMLASAWLIYQGICYGLVPDRHIEIRGALLTYTRPADTCLPESPPDHQLVRALYAYRLGWLAAAGAQRLYGPTSPPADGIRRLLCAVDPPTGRISACAEVGQEFVVHPEFSAVALVVCPEPLIERAHPHRNPLADYVLTYSDNGHQVPIPPIWVICWRNCWQTNNDICRAWWRGQNRGVRRILGR